ncbi:YhdP family protein [Denitratisoma sp. agr-D3]
MSVKQPGLSRLLSSLWQQRWARWLAWGLGTAYVLFALLVLALRYVVLPQVGNYRAELEAALSRSLHLTVAVARLEADWQGLRPRLILSGLEIRDRDRRAALSFDQVQAVLGWTSLLALEPKLHRLEILSPQLAVRRDQEGRLFVAGLEIDTRSNEPGVADWLLKQHQIVVRDAAITWTDEWRQAPPLALTQLNFNLVNNGSRHRFGLTALPPPALAARFDLRGDFRGDDLAHPADWQGQAYVELDYADLAVWRTWVDYPLELPKGSGGLRLWLDLAGTEPVAATADLSLSNVSLRLAKELPMLDLTRLQGRLQAKRLEGGFELSSSKLTLATADGIRIEPLDCHVRWQPLAGELSANHLDLARLVRLAEHLPLPEAVRQGLAKHDPQGRFRDLSLSWSGRQDPFEHYRAVGRFEDLAWVGEGSVPGGSGISGSIDGTEKGGRFEIASKDAGLDLPAVFAESHLAFDKLEVQGRWKRNGSDYDLYLDRSAFRNRDAEGSASGSIRSKAGQQPVLDLEALLSRGEGNAVWKYMPKVVNPDVAAWLKVGIVSGHAENVSLKLKGDLARFPFTDGSGTFRIQGRIFDAVLNYAPGWPRIDGVQGELLFDKARMLISAQRASLMGTVLGPVTAELPDLMANEEMMLIHGKAKGDVQSFLKFIEASPVGNRIDHATADMSGSGDGELDLKLTMPLRHVVDTKVAGVFRFDGDRLLVTPGVPTFEDVRGKLEFTENGIGAKDIRARSLGGAMGLEVKTLGDGLVAVDAQGEATALALRKYIPSSPIASLAPLFDHVTGSTRWEGTVRVKKRNPEIRISSDLKGISIALPEPFNKAATEARPFVLERKTPEARLVPARSKAASRDLIDVSLGRSLRVQLLRNTSGAESQVERGFIGINTPPRLPERGTLFALSASRVDADYWRHLLAAKGGAKAAEGDGGLDLNQVDLRADEVVAGGRRIHELRLQGQLRNDHWLADLRSREIVGRFDWVGTGKGKLVGRISQFTLPESAATGTEATSGGGTGSDESDELPALDLTFDRFVWAGKDFGQLKVAAENRGGFWSANFNVQNDDATLSGEGRWRPDASAADTAVDFKLNVKSLEKLLARLGTVNAVRRGSGTLEGRLTWNGPPQGLDYPSLAGSVKFQLKDGQFNKMEPGVGRLLGIISLQSLPRRITLDFRDIFSEGFAFDSIEGNAVVNRGVLDTRDLEIKGPAALIAMQGTVDLSKETQNLKVRVQPALGETVTTGLVLAHPAVGAAYWVANKLFGRPLDQIFAFEYGVTGAWADPKVEKLGGGVPKEAKEGK